MLIGRRAAHFIRRFGGPGNGSGIVCFRFWQLVPAGGCPYRCSYCFLQTTTWFRCNPEYLDGLVYTNIEDLLTELDEWLKDPTPKMLIVGELQDGLVFEKAYKKVTGRPLSHWIVPLFAAQSRHRLIFLTKSTQVDYALELEPTRQVVFSWSVNAEEVAERWEEGAPLPSERFAAARRVKAAGWPVRFRLDPMLPFPRWRSGYSAVIREINSIGPEMVTLGALRASSPRSLKAAAKKNGRDDGIFQYLTEERDPSGYKYRIPFDVQVELFRFAVKKLAATTIPALCKEDEALWRAVGLPFRGCHCLLGAHDSVVDEERGAGQSVRDRASSSPRRSTVRPGSSDDSGLVQLRMRRGNVTPAP